ncbi:hypothetical protein P4639_22450 [Priestia megaterium]|uniref:hypothetical protein n=1 Tax=Priestia megaterium TaxID=1404 RepID=UPI002E237FE2|nr:hypothetical protein [Priestia megaterium]
MIKKLGIFFLKNLAIMTIMYMVFIVMRILSEMSLDGVLNIPMIIAEFLIVLLMTWVDITAWQKEVA